jgi:hypothetical protein
MAARIGQLVGAVLEKPLVHFLLIGSALLALRLGFAGPDAVDRTIVVSIAVNNEVEKELEANLGRSPNPDELQSALDRWKLEEVAYREAPSWWLGKARRVKRSASSAPT